MVSLSVSAVTAIGAPSPAAAPQENVRICHATGSANNPYVEQEPAIGNNGDLQGGHLGHPQDIIPPYDYIDANGNQQTFPGQNWTPEGQAIWQNGCRPVAPPPDASLISVVVPRSRSQRKRS